MTELWNRIFLWNVRKNSEKIAMFNVGTASRQVMHLAIVKAYIFVDN